jgi:hypothetical protein
MMERLLAKMDVIHAKMDAYLKEMKAEITADNEKFETLRDTLVSRRDAHHATIEARTDVGLEKAKEQTSLEIKSVTVHEEVGKEDAARETGTALNKRHEDRNLGIGLRGKPKKRTHNNGGSRKK